MLRKTHTAALFLMIVILYSCGSTKYFHDPESRDRQKELNQHRSGNVFSSIALTITSAFIMGAMNVDMAFYPEGQEFKKIKLINPTSDSIYVNMLTDVYWDKENYCDFMDIRIPPLSRCKILVPVNANYNLYFSNTPQDDDDEILQFNTNELNRVSLYPGMTITEDSETEDK